MQIKIIGILFLLCVELTVQGISKYARDFANGFFSNVKDGTPLSDNCLGLDYENDITNLIGAVNAGDQALLGSIFIKIYVDLEEKCPKEVASKVIGDAISVISSGDIVILLEIHSTELMQLLKEEINIVELTASHSGLSFAKVVNMLVYNQPKVNSNFLSMTDSSI